MSSSHRNYKYLWSLLPGIVTVAGNCAGGWWALSNFIFTLGILSALEWFVPEEKSNDVEGDHWVPDTILVLHVLVQVLALGSLFWSLSIGRIQGWQLAAAALSTGVHSGSSSIVVAHEMIHRKNAFWQFLGKFLLFTAGNFYFYVQHLRVHHKWVGTAKDPATARFGENLYGFFLRTIFGQITNSWKVEKNRLEKEEQSAFSLRNYVLTNFLLLSTACILLYLYLGPIAVALFLAQSFFANFLLEYTNYIEHYGLSRPENEKVNELLSWQTDKVISRFFLIDLSRHSDHHYHASKPYHTLQTYSGSPVLPGGYASAIYLALIPPLWFSVVHKRLSAFKKNNPSLS